MEKKKSYLFVELPESTKKKAIRLAKKADMSLRQWVKQIINEAKK